LCTGEPKITTTAKGYGQTALPRRAIFAPDQPFSQLKSIMTEIALQKKSMFLGYIAHPFGSMYEDSSQSPQ
jgi:hypothetical protein